MSRRIVVWAIAGFLVACCWAIYASATAPHTNERLRDLWPLAALTCPVVVTRSYFPLGLYLVLAANAATYVLVCLILETLRRHLSYSK